MMYLNDEHKTEPQVEYRPLQEYIDDHMRRVLDYCRGNHTAAGRMLKISRYSVGRWARKHSYRYLAR